MKNKLIQISREGRRGWKDPKYKQEIGDRLKYNETTSLVAGGRADGFRFINKIGSWVEFLNSLKQEAGRMNEGLVCSGYVRCEENNEELKNPGEQGSG